MTEQPFVSRTILALASLGIALTFVGLAARAGEPRQLRAATIAQPGPPSAGMPLVPRRFVGPGAGIDPKIIIPANPNIDPRIVLARNPNIDPGIFVPRLLMPAPPARPTPRLERFRRFDRRRMPR